MVMRFPKMILIVLLVVLAFLWLGSEWVQGADEGWLTPGKSFPRQRQRREKS